MPRTPARFTQADLARAIRAIEQTGADMMVEITADGTIRIFRKVANMETPKLDMKREIKL